MSAVVLPMQRIAEMKRLAIALVLLMSGEALAAGVAARLAGLLPKKAGRLEQLSTSTNRFNFPKEEDHFAVGEYAWGEKPGNAPLARQFRTSAVKLQCSAQLLLGGSTPDTCSGKTVRLGSQDGCLIAEDKPGRGAEGLFIGWTGCFLQFKPGAMKGEPMADATAAATELANWSSSLKR